MFGWFKKRNIMDVRPKFIDPDIEASNEVQSQKIEILKLRNILSFQYNQRGHDSYEIFVVDDQDFIFQLEPRFIYKIELLDKRDKKIKRFFDGQYFKIDHNISFNYGNNIQYNIELKRISKNSPFLHRVVELQEGKGNPETFLEELTDIASSSYTRRDIGEWITKYPGLVHEKYKDVIKNIILLTKLEDHDTFMLVEKDDSVSSNHVWQEKEEDPNESI